jgi:hypothetical protein
VEKYREKRAPIARTQRQTTAKLAPKLPKKNYNMHNINMLSISKYLPVNPQATVGKKWEITGK